MITQKYLDRLLELFIYKYNPDSKNEMLTLKGSVDVKPASGPRHLTFSKDGKFVYFLANSNGGVPLYRLDVQSKKVEKLFPVFVHHKHLVRCIAVKKKALAK